jgi:hypothetical protein
MAIKLYDKGDTIKLKVTFTNSAGVVTDPSSVFMMIQKPATDPSTHSVTSYAMNSMNNPSTGKFDLDIVGNNHGHYKYRWLGTGIVEAAETGEFIVEEWPA